MAGTLVSDLLAPVSTMTVGAVPLLNLDLETLRDANIYLTGEKFDPNFFGKVEEGIKSRQIASKRIEQKNSNESILGALGNPGEIRLAHLIWLIKQQASGIHGFLLADGSCNHAFIRDKRRNLQLVSCMFCFRPYRSWKLISRRIDHPVKQDVGGQVLKYC